MIQNILVLNVKKVCPRITIPTCPDEDGQANYVRRIPGSLKSTAGGVMTEKFAERLVEKLRKLFRTVVTGLISSRVVQNVLGTITAVSIPDAVALTFDDGPHAEYTPRLLDILEKHQVHATFFMIGEYARENPEIVRQVAEAGHAIGNHSWNHPSFPFVSWREQRRQIRKCAKATAPYGRRLLRPPYGHQNVASRLNALLLRYKVVNWGVHAEDWLDHDPGWMADRLEKKIRPGSIVLLHDGLFDALDARHFNREQTLEAVDKILERLKGRFRFVTIPELIKKGRPQRWNWYLTISDSRVPNVVKQLNRLKRPKGKARQYTEASWNYWMALLPK